MKNVRVFNKSLQKYLENTIAIIEQSTYSTLYIFTHFGARYLDPMTTRWLSVDPAMYQGDYIPGAPINDEVRRNNNNLPGMGGIYNYFNMHVYHYGGNNPVKYVDPDGRNLRRTIVIIFNPIKALIVRRNSVLALEMARNSGLGGSNSGEQDAFRHIVWNALNTRDIGETATKRFGDAHEARRDQPASDRIMDLENNAIGREIGRTPGITNEEIYDRAMEEIIAARNPTEEDKRYAIISLPETDARDYNYGHGIEDID